MLLARSASAASGTSRLRLPIVRIPAAMYYEPVETALETAHVGVNPGGCRVEPLHLSALSEEDDPGLERPTTNLDHPEMSPRTFILTLLALRNVSVKASGVEKHDNSGLAGKSPFPHLPRTIQTLDLIKAHS